MARHFEVVARHYIRRYLPTLKDSTAKEYRRLLEKEIMPAFRGRTINSIKIDDVEGLQLARRKSPAVANKIITVLSSLFTWAADREMRSPDLVNPASKIKRFKSLPKETYLDQDGIETLLLSLPDDSFGDIVKLLVLTGARKGEIEGLEWGFIDWERSVARLPDSKTGAGRVIYLNKPALDILRNRKPLYGARGYVFPSAIGGHYSSTSDQWLRFRKQIDMEHIRLHDLRHTFASQAVNAGHSLAVIGALLGHSNVTTTQRYAHLQSNTLVDAANDIGRGME